MFKNALKTPGNVITLSQSIECSLEPVELLEHLSNQAPLKNRMLLESCQIDNKQQLKSILVNQSALRIECLKNEIVINALSFNGENAIHYLAEIFKSKKVNCKLINETKHSSLLIKYSEEEVTDIDEEQRLKQITPIDCLRSIQQAFSSKSNNPFSIFICGLFSFDFIASFEKLPEVDFDINDCPDYVFYLAEEVIVFDHQTRHTKILSNIFSGIHTSEDELKKNYYEQSRRMGALSELILNASNNTSKKLDISHLSSIEQASIQCNLTNEQYETIIGDLKKEIIAGNIFQVVPSRTFSIKSHNHLLSYRYLKETNPSPYMFYMQDESFTLFGASPESALKYQADSNKVELYPIAGTRVRGKLNNGEIDHDLDKRLEAELKQDHKEISEHMMLVDLARNDIARISKTNSIQIPRLLEVDRYSQVMHLVSCVQGDLRADLDCFHAYQACMNMGTLTGAPKIKATELIRKTEQKRRGSYGGAVGYINTHGDMDTCIVIRSAFCKDGIAHIQAGAGVVYDSVPQLEAEETKNKAKAVINAIQLANHSIKNNEENP